MKPRHAAPLLSVALLCPLFNPAAANDDLKKLQDEKALVEARTELAKAQIAEKSAVAIAELAALKAADELAKARAAALDFQKIEMDKATAADLARTTAIKAANDLTTAMTSSETAENTAAKAKLDSQTSLAAAKFNADYADLTAMKAVLGAVPATGNEGLVSVADGSAATLQQIRFESLNVAWLLARQLCTKLTGPTFFAPEDLDLKIQTSQLFLREFDSLAKNVNDPANSDQVKGGATASSAAAVMTAAAVVQYGAAAMQGIVKLFRSDYSVGISETKRDMWLEYFTARQCGGKIPHVRPDLTLRRTGQKDVLEQMEKMADFLDNAAATKAALNQSIITINAKIAESNKKNAPHTALDNDLADKQALLAGLAKMEVWLPRVQALLTAIATKPELYQEAFVWRKLDAAPYNDMNRLFVSIRTQDAQIVKTNWLLGKRVYGKSAGELVYRVTGPDGKLIDVSYFSAEASTGKIDFDLHAASLKP
jgi:hypothetical protein